MAITAWTLPHAFFVSMGGSHYANEHGPVHPLDPATVIILVREGKIVPPTADELSSQSKGDAISKGFAILQTLWFIMQCIARRAQLLEITKLESLTLTYAIIMM